MRAGIVFLGLGYVLSQFYRAFLAVLAPALTADLGMDPESLARASGLWFLAFAAMQLPVGWALDRFGPRLTAVVLMAVGAAGALVFALAPSAGWVHLAMMMIGAGCAPVLMAAYYIFARVYPPHIFATLAGVTVGIGTLGNIASSLPLAWGVEALGWRAVMVVLAGITALSALAVGVFVTDPPRAAAGAPKGSLRQVLSLRGMWPVIPALIVGYAPMAAVRGLWIGPYMRDVHGLDAAGIGRMSLLMGLFMVAGSFASAPLDRVFGTRKWVVLPCLVLTAASLAALAAFGGASLTLDMVMLCALGLFGATYAVQMAHGRAFLPPHLTGRGVTLLNLFSIGSVGVFQFASARLFAAASPGATALTPFSAIFAAFAAAVIVCGAIYLISRDRTD